MEKISEKKYKVIDGVIQGKEKMKFDWEYDLSNGRSRGHKKSYAFYLQNIDTKDVIRLYVKWKKVADKWVQDGYRWTQGKFTFLLSIGKEEAIITKVLA